MSSPSEGAPSMTMATSPMPTTRATVARRDRPAATTPTASSRADIVTPKAMLPMPWKRPATSGLSPNGADNCRREPPSWSTNSTSAVTAGTATTATRHDLLPAHHVTAAPTTLTATTTPTYTASGQRHQGTSCTSQVASGAATNSAAGQPANDGTMNSS